MAENEEVTDDSNRSFAQPDLSTRVEPSIEVTVETTATHHPIHQYASDSQLNRKIDTSPANAEEPPVMCEHRVYKKSSSNNKLTLYLASRDLVVYNGKIDKLYGVLMVDPDFLQDRKVYAQLTLTFRYGREDEEVMGLKFCNEVNMCLAQIYPTYPGAEHQEPTTLIQENLIKKLGPNAHAFSMTLTPLAPPSVQLVPAKEYNGAPIGTSYEIRVYVADRPGEKSNRKSTWLRMGLRVIQGSYLSPLQSSTMCNVPFSDKPCRSSNRRTRKSDKTKTTSVELEIMNDNESAVPRAAMEKQFLLSDGPVRLEASLDRLVYTHGDPITVNVNIVNNSNKTVNRVKVMVVQHVDVCMFSNGKFKNTVAAVSSRDGCPVIPGYTLNTNYSLTPEKGSTKNWIALEDSFSNTGATLASTVVCSGNDPKDRNVFAIYVSYYVKVKIVISLIGELIGGTVFVKLPFILTHSSDELDQMTNRLPLSERLSRQDGEKASRKRETMFGDKMAKQKKIEATRKEEKERMSNADLIEDYEETKSI